MSKVTCCECGKFLDTRSMNTCSECFSYLCPNCAQSNNGYCSSCAESDQDMF